MGLHRTNIYLTDVEQKYLRKVAKRIGITSAELIRRVLDAWIEKEEIRFQKRGKSKKSPKTGGWTEGGELNGSYQG